MRQKETICQIPNCPRVADRPVGLGQICTPCRLAVVSRVRFCPPLFWGSLWIMARELKSLLLEKTQKHGEISLDYRQYWEARDLLCQIHSGRLADFLTWAHNAGVELPKQDLEWLNKKFMPGGNEKSQLRVLVSYWKMLSPTPLHRDWIILVHGSPNRATANTSLRSVEKVVRAMEVRQGAWILTTSWSELTTEAKQLTAE